MGWNALAGVAVLAVALVAVVVLEDNFVSNSFDPAASRTRAESTAANLVPPDQDDQREKWLSTALARPLFTPDRRPPAAAVPIAASADIPRLSGILVTPFGRSAIFAPPNSSKPMVVTEGTVLGPYTVKAITPDEVTVVGPSGARSLRPAFDPASAPVGRGPGPMMVPRRLGPRASEASPASESSQ